MSTTSTLAQLEALLNGPAGTPPPGVLPILEDTPNLHVAATIAYTICLVFASLAVFIRIYTRQFLLHSMGYDDYFSLISWLFLIGFFVNSTFVSKAGAGSHMWNLQLKTFFELLHLANIGEIVYAPAAFFAKLSILLQYSRIFAPTTVANLPLVIAIRSCICINLIFYAFGFFFAIFECSPREKIWNRLETTGSCRNVNVALQASGLFNVLSDFMILVIPLPLLWKLQMSLKKKSLTTAVFAIGLLACLTSIIRTYYTYKITTSSDESFLFNPLGEWSMAELSAGIVVGCFPVMPKFFQHVGPKAYEILSLGSRSAHSRNSKHRARVATPRADAFIKIKNPFGKYNAGPLSEFDRSSDAQLHGEHYILEELHEPQTQTQTTQAAGTNVATRRDDLEHGLPQA